MSTEQYNPILDTDSYKLVHYKQYPPHTTNVFSYIESRGGKYPATVFFGLQYYIKKYLCTQVTYEMIDDAEIFFNKHMTGLNGMFNRVGWEYIVKHHDGYLPLKIKAVPEGTIVPVSNVLATVENTDPNCFWLTSYVETALLRNVWYATTVATNSYTSKQIIKKFLEKTGDLNGLPFALHDFGSRGVSSKESAGIGGVSHLVNFFGSDTIEGAVVANEYYNCDMSAFSVSASEHSTMTTWGGKEGEIDAMRNMLTQFAKPGNIVAVVSDSYDIYNAVSNLWGEELRQEVINSGATIVIRPDSGDPTEVVTKIVKLLDEKFGSTLNEKNYKVLNNVRVIQGDGINTDTIESILTSVTNEGYSANNISFGQGGGLLQQLDRDTCKFAMKCSAAKINNKWIDVYKNPITDSVKKSKKGRLMLYKNSDNLLFTDREGLDQESILHTVFLNGKIEKEYTFEEVRRNAGTLI